MSFSRSEIVASPIFLMRCVFLPLKICFLSLYRSYLCIVPHCVSLHTCVSLLACVLFHYNYRRVVGLYGKDAVRRFFSTLGKTRQADILFAGSLFLTPQLQ